MIEHKWQAGDECKTRDGRPCRILNWTSGGILYWEVDNGELHGWSVYASRPDDKFMAMGSAPQPPTREVVNRYRVADNSGVFLTYPGDVMGQRVAYEVEGRRIVSVRLLD